MHRFDEIARRRWIVVSRVGDTQPSARAQFLRLELQLVAKLDEKVEHDLHRILVRVEREDLRPDVGMESHKLQTRMPQCSLDSTACSTRLDREAKLRIQLSCRDVIVCVRLDARR